MSRIQGFRSGGSGVCQPGHERSDVIHHVANFEGNGISPAYIHPYIRGWVLDLRVDRARMRFRPAPDELSDYIIER